MKIEVRKVCRECDGQGKVDNPFYKDYDSFVKSFSNETGEKPTIEQEDAWLKLQGYEQWPREEFRCHVCDGAGEYSEWIDIKELAKIIKELPC